jgi:hypothetical protein
VVRGRLKTSATTRCEAAGRYVRIVLQCLLVRHRGIPVQGVVWVTISTQDVKGRRAALVQNRPARTG